MDQNSLKSIDIALSHLASGSDAGSFAVDVGNAVGSSDAQDHIDAAVSTSGLAIGIVSKFGGNIPNPLGFGVSSAAVINDLNKVINELAGGQIKTKDLVSLNANVMGLLSDIAIARAGQVALAAAAGVTLGAASASALAAIGVVLTVTSVATTIAAMAIDDSNSIDINDMISDLMDGWEDFKREFGDLAQEIMDHVIDGLHAVRDGTAEIMSDIGEWLFDQLNNFLDFGDACLEELENMSESIGKIFGDFLNWLPRRDPLSLDLDGDGLETMAQAGFNGVLFDHDGDGVKTASGWIGRDDGFLARDLNGNGRIDSGAELFGDSTRLRNGQLAKNGFEALADLDENADGRVDASDSAFTSLRVWKDANSNGVVDAGELRTLADWGITALNTEHTSGSTNLGDGNQLAERGSYVGANNQLGLMGDLNFSESNFHRTFSDHIAPTARTRNLADARGAGMVRDLREAATLSDTVATLVEQYSAVTTRGAQMTRIVL